MTSKIINRNQLFQAQARAYKKYGLHGDFLYREAVSDLTDRLAMTMRDFPLAIALTDSTGYLSETLRRQKTIETVYRTNWTDNANGDIDITCDEEALPFQKESVNLITSVLGLQWINDLPGSLFQIRQTLKPDGLFIGTLIGGDTLHELRDALTSAELEYRGGAALRVLPFVEIRAFGALLQRAGFSLPVVDQDSLTVRYDTVFDLIRDIRAMGAGNCLIEQSGRPLTRQIALRMAEIYAERYSDPDGRIRATFQMISFSGWAPHESQQKPLQPGSAKTSLAEAVKAMEKSSKKVD